MSRDLSTGKILQLAPLMPVFIAFALGIIVGGWSPLSFSVLYALIALTILLPALAFIQRWRFSFFLIVPVFFSLGLLFIGPYGPGLMPPGHIAASINEGAEAGRQSRPLYDVRGVVVSEPVFTGRYTRFIVSTRSITVKGRRQKVTGGVRLSVRGKASGIGRGDTVRFLGYLKLPHNFGNPGEFNYVRWLRVRGVEALGNLRSPRWIIRLHRARPGLLSTSARARKGINAFITASGAGNPAILKALVTGDKSGLSPKIRLAFTRAGVAHVLAISGLHVGIVALFTYAIILFILRLCPFLALRINIKKAALLMSLFPVLTYGLMAGFSRPTERAVIMAVALIVAVFLDRGRSLYNTLALAGLIILIMAPASIFEASFQLSFLAVFFILFISPVLFSFFLIDAEDGLKPVSHTAESWIWSRVRGAKNILAFINKDDKFRMQNVATSAESGLLARGRRILSIVKIRGLGLFVVTIAASLGTWPVVAYYFSTVSTVGLLSNLIVLPITTLLVEALFLSAILIPVSGLLAGWGFHLAGWLAGVQLALVRAFAAFSFSSIHLSRPSPLEVFLMYVLIFCLFSLKRARLYRYLALLSALMLIVLIAYPFVERAGNPRLRVTFISVGQGDAALVEFPEGSVMLIDGGGFRGGSFDTGKGIIAPLLRYKKIRRIDYMVLSHAQQDHMGGLGYVAANFPVSRFWWNGLGDLRELGEVLADKGVPKTRLGAKRESFMVDNVRVEVLPLDPKSEFGFNDSSLVVRLTYGVRSFLFTGDMEAPAEGYISTLKNISADVLKAPHHGSSTSSTMGLLRAVRPKFTVISLGRGNRFGFPSGQSLARYKRVGSRVLRTDRDGAVEISTDGKNLEVRSFGG